MAPLLLVRALVCWIVMGVGAGRAVATTPNLRRASEAIEECPRCDTIFTMVETLESEERVQLVEMAERGEPKSGTTFMYHWAHGALEHTCNFLNTWFGRDSCHVETGRLRGMFHTPEEVSLIFDPRLGGEDKKCSCESVDRVEISVTDYRKHNLPVALDCEWQHAQGIAKGEVSCSTADGKPAESFDDIALCMKETACPVTDHRRQFVIMRDPRAGAVSTYFHEKIHEKVYNKEGGVGASATTLDEFVLVMVPVLCQWLTLRYLLFTEVMGPQSTIFWYDDGLNDAVTWHKEWVASAGVHLPMTAVEVMADAALREDFAFDTKGKNTHPGETTTTKKNEETDSPTWQEMLSPETLMDLDVIARKWLPPAILAKLSLLE